MPMRTVTGQDVLVPVNRRNLFAAAKYGIPANRATVHKSGASSQPQASSSSSAPARGARASTAPPSVALPAQPPGPLYSKRRRAVTDLSRLEPLFKFTLSKVGSVQIVGFRFTGSVPAVGRVHPT